MQIKSQITPSTTIDFSAANGHRIRLISTVIPGLWDSLLLCNLPSAIAVESPAEQMQPITHLSTLYMIKFVANALAVPNTAMIRYVAIIIGFLPNL